ncbi:MAG: ABC transporter ATP-binding protein [Clostridia bacterium]|jgi:putative ABC transport system ATP-binding protein|nr:ABC transporter ATP-binding protein [Clostridia bacterium]
MKELIVLKNIHKHYRMSQFTVKALDGVDVTIESGEFVALVGPSGSGKSTLMNVLGCLDMPTSGEYYIRGNDVSSFSDAKLAQIRNREVGFVFQSFNLMSNMTALQNVALPGKYQKMSSRQSIKRARIAIEMVGLQDRASHLPKELSGGQQQRVAFARALLCNPSLLLADEPTGNLDSKTGKEILELISSLNKQGMTVVLVTHDESIADVASRKISLLDGKIISDEKCGGAA